MPKIAHIQHGLSAIADLLVEPPGGLGATYSVHLRLIGKHMVDFLLVLIELLLLDAAAEVLWANVNWKSAISLQRGQLHPKFQVEQVAPHQPFSFSEN